MLLVGRIVNANLNNSAVEFAITDNLAGDEIVYPSGFKPVAGKTYRNLKFKITVQNSQITDQTIYVDIVENLSSTFIRNIYYDKVLANSVKTIIFDIDYLFKATAGLNYNYRVRVGSTGQLTIIDAYMIQKVLEKVYYATSY